MEFSRPRWENGEPRPETESREVRGERVESKASVMAAREDEGDGGVNTLPFDELAMLDKAVPGCSGLRWALRMESERII